MTTGHNCPGGCARQVNQAKFACLPCWRRLPVDLRRPITQLYNRDLLGHLQAMSDARRWYRENPPGAGPSAKRLKSLGASGGGFGDAGAAIVADWGETRV